MNLTSSEKNLGFPAFDIGKLKAEPVALYDLCILLFDIDMSTAWDTDSEVYKAFKGVCLSLWGALPPIVTIDFRDPDDPNTWGCFGPPPGATAAV